MGGDRGLPELMFYVANTEEGLPADHPLRAVKRRAEAVFEPMEGSLEKAYSEPGRPSLPPEALLKALLLQALYSISSERRRVEALHGNLLYRWLVDRDPDGEWPLNTRTFADIKKRCLRHPPAQITIGPA